MIPISSRGQLVLKAELHIWPPLSERESELVRSTHVSYILLYFYILYILHLQGCVWTLDTWLDARTLLKADKWASEVAQWVKGLGANLTI